MRKHLCRVPPAPDVLRELYIDFKNSGLGGKVTFAEYLTSLGYTDPSVNRDGMDDGVLFKRAAGPQLFEIPAIKVQGRLRVIVLLVDFPDRKGIRPVQEYETLLFAPKTDSMADFYDEATEHKVQIEGSVHGWLTLPQQYKYYVNNESGMGNDHNTSYPHNAQRMAEDAVKAAMAQHVPFPATLDCLGQGLVTALFIIHAGPGAEVMQPPLDRKYIWSHKWNLTEPISVAPALDASVYLTVPENCKVGVCAHELGHLAFQWEDFYDANYAKDGQYWDGSGTWDLMAGGSYNGNGARPAHPAGLHKMQHGWVPVEELGPRAQPHEVTLPPYGSPGAKVLKVRSPRFSSTQYLILENRQSRGFENALPGSGLLVWRIDEDLTNVTPSAGLFLIEADENNALLNPNDGNQGDAGDPFPGATVRVELGDQGPISTSFPGRPRSGVYLTKIAQNTNGSVSLLVTVTP
jgi:immune inhibitor A